MNKRMVIKAPLIELRAIDSLVASPNNARTHSPAQIDQIAASIVEFGFVGAVMADDTGIIAGHGRVMAATKIYAGGGTISLPDGTALDPGTVPVINVSGWMPEQRRAYMLADNQLALNAGWDDAILRAEIEALLAVDFHLDVIGFDPAEIHRLLESGAGATDPENVPPTPENPVSILGDIWIMGGHRIACGSSTNPEDVKAVLAGAKPHLMVTDPPYGVDYDPAWRGTAKSRDGKRTSLGVHAKGQVLNDDRADWIEAWMLFSGDVAYVWHAGTRAGEVQASLVNSGFDIRTQIIWAKNNIVIGRGDYHWKHEPCWYAVRKGGKSHWQGSRKETTIWDIDKPQKSETGHSTQKPVECMQRPIENNSKVGDAVYEPFSGSGTTIIAGQITGRRVLAIELNPAYVDVAVMRWQAFANATATLEGDGRTFDEIKAERCGQSAEDL